MKRWLTVLFFVTSAFMPAAARADASAEQIYANQALVLAHVASETYQYASDLANDPHAEDPVWMAQFVAIWSMMEILQRTLTVIEVPSSFAESFGYFSESINVLADHAAYCRAGIIALQAVAIDTCTGYIQQASSLISLATTTMTQEAEAAGISLGG